VTFKPGKEMEERVRELERQAAAARAATVGQSLPGEDGSSEKPASSSTYSNQND